MQRLYETHKVLTYPRTDSPYLTEDIVPTLQERLKVSAVGELSAPIGDILKNRRSIAKTCVNDARVSDHHAIIPTEEPPNFLNMSAEEKKIYFLVMKRFIAAFYPHWEYENIRVTLSCEGETFTAQGKVVSDKGWKRVYDWDR